MAISGGAEYAHEQQAYHAAMAKAAAVKILRARALAAKKKSISYQQMMQRNQQASNKQRAQEKIEYTRGPYGYLGSYFSDLNFKEAEKTNETASLVSMYKNANANFNAWQLSLKSVFGTENYNTALSKYNSILTALNTDEANLKSLETNYSSALSTANTAIQNAKINNGMVTVNGGGISIPLFLENLGFKSLPYGSKLSTSQVELPGVGSFSAAAPAGFYNANVGTWAFHPNQFNEIESTAKSADNLFATAQSQQSILNAYVNANNQLAKVDQLISALPAWGQQSILSEISGHPSASTSWFPKNISTIQINPSQNTTSATSSQLTAAAGTSIGSSFLSDIGSAFHTLTNPSTYTSLPGEIANGLGAAGSTLTNPQSWIAAGNSIYSAGKTAVKTGETIVKGTENIASSYIGDIIQGYHTYHVTPAGAYTNAQAMAGKLTPAENEAVAKGEVITEKLLPSQIPGQVAEMQSEYGHNAVEQFLFGMGNSQGDIFANPISSAQKYGIGSSQFSKSLVLSELTLLGEGAIAPISLGATVGVASATAGASFATQLAARAGAQAVIGAASNVALSEGLDYAYTGKLLTTKEAAETAAVGGIMGGLSELGAHIGENLKASIDIATGKASVMEYDSETVGVGNHAVPLYKGEVGGEPIRIVGDITEHPASGDILNAEYGGKEDIVSTHVTTQGDAFKILKQPGEEVTLIGRPEGAGGWRAANEQYHFYSAPPEVETGEVTAYGGYAGVGADEAGRVILGGKNTIIEIKNPIISDFSPKAGESTFDYLNRISHLSGETGVAPEDFIEKNPMSVTSTERQFITPAKYESDLYGDLPGSKLIGEGKIGDIIIRQEPSGVLGENPITNWLFTRNTRFEVIGAHVEPITGYGAGDVLTEHQTSTLDVGKYNEEWSESAGSTAISAARASSGAIGSILGTTISLRSITSQKVSKAPSILNSAIKSSLISSIHSIPSISNKLSNTNLLASSSIPFIRSVSRSFPSLSTHSTPYRSTRSVPSKQSLPSFPSIPSTPSTPSVPLIRSYSNPSTRYVPIRHKEEPAQLLFPFKENPSNRRKRQLQMLYAPFPDLLDVNEVANTGKKPIALNPSNPKTYKIYRKEMMQSGGLRYRTYNQLFGSLRKKGKKEL